MTYDKNKIYPEYIIYKLCSDECDEFYIGSTRNMVQRRRTHKGCCNNPNSPAYNTKKYQNIRDNGGFENWRLVPVERLENVSRFDAECREEVVRVELNAKLNSIRASCGGMTKTEYNAEYRQEHLDYYNEYNAEYRQENREYFENYRQENREELYRKQQEKFDCDCGGKYTRNHKNEHFKSKKHIRYLEQIE
tara:strand:+ start:137 stop:712 length:576 start_codon:yes stop_codon:yes gene_type:complete